MRTLRHLPPVSLAHCVRRAIPASRLVLRSLRFKTHFRRAWGLLVRRHPYRYNGNAGDGRPPRFLGNPRDGSPGSWTPVGPTRQALRRAGAAPACVNNEGSRREKTFEARCPGFPSHCLRFVGWVAPPRRKTRFRLLASSTGRDSDPQGSDGRFPSCSRYISSPFPRLCLAQ